MLEIPESYTVAGQLNQTIPGKVIHQVVANSSPHRFAFYFGDPQEYHRLLAGKAAGPARAIGGLVEIEFEQERLLLGDGTNIRYYPAGEAVPPKHQLHIRFEDGTSLVGTIQMYGGLWAYHNGENDNRYYLIALEKPSPLTEKFDEAYFYQLLAGVKQNLSVKAFLATEQRIPGLGNGTLQDILFFAKINPKSKLEKLSTEEKATLFTCIKQTLGEMTAKGGRDTERDLFGNHGGYETVLSAGKLNSPCPRCGGSIVKQAFLGGSVYYCPNCQPVKS